MTDRYRVPSDSNLYDHVPCGLLTVTDSGEIVRANETLSTWTDFPVSELIGKRFITLLDPEVEALYEEKFGAALLERGEVREVGLVVRTGGGGRLPVLTNAVVHQVDGVRLIHFAVFDVTQRSDHERRLLAAHEDIRRSEARTQVLQSATIAFGESATVEELAAALVHSVKTGLGASAAAIFIDDHDPRLVAGTVPIDASDLPGGVPLEDARSLEGRLWSIDDGVSDSTTSALTAAGLHAMLTIPLSYEGAGIGTLASYFDGEPQLDWHAWELLESLGRQAAQTLARLRLQDELAAIALYDPLTGLANRVLLQNRLTAAIATAAERQEPLAVLFVDVDNFKAINDELDHTAGDAVLKLTAARLRAAVREADLVARYGGDEFIILCPDTDEDGAAVLGERIRLAVKRPLRTDGWERTITASIGVSVYRASADDRTSNLRVLRAADQAMYRSKDTGKDRVSIGPADQLGT